MPFLQREGLGRVKRPLQWLCVQACPTGAMRAFKLGSDEWEQRIKTESLSAYSPEYGCDPRVLYKNLKRFTHGFIAGSVALKDVDECAEGAKVILKNGSGKKIQNRLEKKWKLKVDDFASHKVAEKIDIPVLIVHDTKDGDVPVSCAYNIRQNLQKGSLLVSHGLGHTKILRDKEIVNKSVEFIIQNT